MHQYCTIGITEGEKKRERERERKLEKIFEENS